MKMCGNVKTMLLIGALIAGACLGACGSSDEAEAKNAGLSAEELSHMDGHVIDKASGEAAVHAALRIPSPESFKRITLVPDTGKAEELGLAMEEDGYVDFEQYKVLSEGVWQDAAPPNRMPGDDGAESRKFGFVSDIQAEGVTASPEEAAKETENYLQELTGFHFKTFRVQTMNPYREGDGGEYWVWLMLKEDDLPVLESPGDVGVVAKYAAQGVYAYYGRFLFREENEKQIDSFEDPEKIADTFLAGNFGTCERAELFYVLDPSEKKKVLIPAWAFLVQEENSLKAYLYSAEDGHYINVRELEMLY